MSSTQTGGCLCGNIRYSAEVNDSVMSGHCQCKDCQRSTGSARSTFCLFPDQQFALTQGELSSYTVTAKSGKTVTRHFCGNCWTPILSGGEGMPGMALVKAGSFDDSSWVKPSMLFWQSTAPAWGEVGDDVACMETNP
jgi:hypothetical protein